MGNTPSWLSKWQRSPRQDRRVIEDGKFVELGKVQVPEPPPAEEVTEREQSALELVVPAPNVPAREEISGTVFEEARHESAEEQEGSAGANVLPDAQEGSSTAGLEPSGDSTDANPRDTVGATGEIPVPSVSTPEGPSVSEASQAELEPLPLEDSPSGTGGKFVEWPVDAVAATVEGSQTVAEIVESLKPLPGDVIHDETILTEEQSDALAETLRLPESPENEPDLPF